MKKIAIFIVLALTTTLVGCVSTSTMSKNTKTPAHVYSQNYDKVYEKSVNAALELGWQVIYSDKNTGVLSLKAPMNLATWGQDVTVKLTKKDSGVQVDMTSATQYQLFDWGRGSSDIKKFYQKLDDLLVKA